MADKLMYIPNAVTQNYPFVACNQWLTPKKVVNKNNYYNTLWTSVINHRFLDQVQNSSPPRLINL